MQILIVNRALGTLFGGGESFDYNAARHLAARGHDVTLITRKPMWGQPKNCLPDPKVIYVSAPNLRHFAYATQDVSRKLSAAFYHLDNAMFERAVLVWFASQPKDTFDIVQCCSLFDLPRMLLSTYSQPVISWLPGPPSGRVRARLPRLIANPHFGLFTHGATEWTLLEMGLKRGSEFDIIEPGIDLSAIDKTVCDRSSQRRGLGIGVEDLLGITTARLVPVKNHKLLLAALVRAKELGVIWRWLFIGDGPLESRLKEKADTLGIADQVRFLGHQSPQELHAWLAVADLFALTSTYESFSIATLEAMAHRLPVVGTDVGYLQTLITRAKAGRVVSPMDIEQLATTLVDLSVPENRVGYGEDGRQSVRHLDWPNIATRLETFYCKVIKGRSA